MRIVHLCICIPYNDYWGYQENLLPKYHRKQGHEVTVITTNTKQVEGGFETVPAGRYHLDDGQQIIRLDYERGPIKKLSVFQKKFNILPLLRELKPDFIMVHGLVNCTALQVKKYVQKYAPHCRVVADSHIDYDNEYPYRGMMRKLLFAYYRRINRRMASVYETVFGVTPGRVEYMQKEFGIAPERSALLVMGADDEAIAFDKKDKLRKELCKNYGIPEDDFLIATGGRIEEPKNIHTLMQAFAQADLEHTTLLVFGSTHPAIGETIQTLAKHPKICYIGWVDSQRVYDIFLSAQLAFFPGSHSVLWEQSCACGIPSVFKDDPGRRHVDLGGNCILLQDCGTEALRGVLEKICNNKDFYESMLRVAQDKNISYFSYNNIAHRVLLPRNEWRTL